jgi:DNA-binding transcriptional MerR regulator
VTSPDVVRLGLECGGGDQPKGRILIGSEANQSGGKPEGAGSGIWPLAALESSLIQLEAARPDGLTSGEILDILARHGVSISEATLRKYVQLGLLPRSVRVGTKGKHRGSRGLYPTEVVRRIALIKALMAERYTIEEIRRRLVFLSVDIDKLEAGIKAVLSKLRQSAEATASLVAGGAANGASAGGGPTSGNLAVLSGRPRSDVGTIERLGRELLQRLRKLDRELCQHVEADDRRLEAGAAYRQVV